MLLRICYLLHIFLLRTDDNTFSYPLEWRAVGRKMAKKKTEKYRSRREKKTVFDFMEEIVEIRFVLVNAD